MSQTDAIDAATCALYEQVRVSPRHAALIRRVESSQEATIEAPAPLVVVMPGAFHAQYPHTGADGKRVLELARELGWPAEVVPAPSLGSMAENAAILAEFLTSRSGKPIVLVSLSKGGSDVRAALQSAESANHMRDVRTWVNISGIVTGTPLVKWLQDRPLRCWGAKMLLWCRRQRWACIEELRHGPDAPLGRTLTLPAGMRAIHVAGFPSAADLSNDWARRGHARLAPLGPNDGGGILLRDLLALPGEIYPVRGADHYLNPRWDVRPVLRRILIDAARPSPGPQVHGNAQQHPGDDVNGVMLLGGERGVED